MNSPAKGKHIAGIDGLRAISVLAVIAFHYFATIESAGYLGVDVFFVISGFVITASIASYETPKSFKNFAVEFYLRRFKRLLPALFAVVIFTSILVMLVTTEGKDNLRTGALALIGGANIFLYIKEADYFALTSELNPFTHMWSLAVEDQFYLLFPFLLWGCAFFSTHKKGTTNSRLLTVLGTICIASLSAFIALFYVDYSFSFYMMPTRLWQIGAGVLVYLLVSRSNLLLVLKSIPIVIPVILLIGILAFGHILPLLAHIGVTVVTAIALAILWFSQEQENFLGHSIPVYLGKISYSLYLWHWPFLVLAKHTVGTSPTVIIICLILTFVFASASYHFLEQPIRYAKTKTSFPEKEKLFQKVLTTVIASVLVLYIGVSRYAPKENNLLAISLGVPPVEINSRHRCHGIRALKKLDSPLSDCLGQERTEEKPSKLYLLGDSHANQYAQILGELLQETPYRLQYINAESHEQGVSGLISRENFVPHDFKFMMQDAQAHDVLVLTFHRGRLNEKMDTHLELGEEVPSTQHSKNFISNLQSILPDLKKKNVGLLFIYDTPLMASVTTVQSCAIQTKLGGSNICTVTREQDIHTRKLQEQAYSTLQKNIPEIQVWDPLPAIYKDKFQHDILDAEGNYLMYDWSHISDRLAEELKVPLKQALDKLLTKSR